MKDKRILSWIPVIVYLLLLVLFTFKFESFKQVLYKIFGANIAWDGRYELSELIFQHVYIVLVSNFFALIVGLILGIICVTSYGKEVKDIIEKWSYLLYMVPSMALLYIMVPIVGTGRKPAIIALIIIGFLPIFMSVVAGVNNIPADLSEVSYGLGMSEMEKLIKIDLPLALPVIISGCRTSMIINISAATLASDIGGGGLGMLLFSSMKNGNPVAILEGTVPIVLIALLVDKTLKNIEEYFS